MSPIKVVFIAAIAFLACGAFERVHGILGPGQTPPQAGQGPRPGPKASKQLIPLTSEALDRAEQVAELARYISEDDSDDDDDDDDEPGFTHLEQARGAPQENIYGETPGARQPRRQSSRQGHSPRQSASPRRATPRSLSPRQPRRQSPNSPGAATPPLGGQWSRRAMRKGKPSAKRCARSVDGGCQDDSSPYSPDVKQSSTIRVKKFTVVNNMRMEMFGHVLFLPAHSAETLFLMVKEASSQLLVSSEPFEISRGQTSLTIPPLTVLDPNQWYNLTLMTSSHKILQTVMYKPQRGTRVLGLKLFHRLDGQLKGAIQLSGNVERLVSVDLYDTTETFELIKSVQLTGLHAKPVRLDDKFPRLSFGHSYLVAVVDYETNENIFTQTFTVHRTTNRGHSTRFAGRTLIDHLFDSLR